MSSYTVKLISGSLKEINRISNLTCQDIWQGVEFDNLDSATLFKRVCMKICPYVEMEINEVTA